MRAGDAGGYAVCAGSGLSGLEELDLAGNGIGREGGLVLRGLVMQACDSLQVFPACTHESPACM